MTICVYTPATLRSHGISESNLCAGANLIAFSIPLEKANHSLILDILKTAYESV